MINCQKNPVLSLVVMCLHLQVLPEWPVRSKLLSWHCKVMWPFRVTSTVTARSHFPPNYNAQLCGLSFIIMLIWRDFHAIFGLLIPKERGKFLWAQFKGERSIFRMKFCNVTTGRQRKTSCGGSLVLFKYCFCPFLKGEKLNVFGSYLFILMLFGWWLPCIWSLNEALNKHLFRTRLSLETTWHIMRGQGDQVNFAGCRRCSLTFSTSLFNSSFIISVLRFIGDIRRKKCRRALALHPPIKFRLSSTYCSSILQIGNSRYFPS